MEKYILMHKNIPVLACEIDDGTIIRVSEIYNQEHAPVGTYGKWGIGRNLLNAWFQRRCIPSGRNNIDCILQILGIHAAGELLDKAYGLSLSDTYWMKPENSMLKWEKINFFDNDFPEDLGKLLIGEKMQIDSDNFSLFSPDITTDGWLEKQWNISGGKRYLIKAGSGNTRQEPLNEKIASELCRLLDIRHISYSVKFAGTGEPYSVCEDYITRDTELVTAYALCSLYTQSNDESDYDFYVRVCKNIGIKDIALRMDEMLCVDYLMANTDRHWTNFGVVRNADTLEYIETMPIFDTGTSLWHDVPDFLIGRVPVRGKMFRTSMGNHLRYVKDASFLNFERLRDFPEIVREILSSSGTMSQSRIDLVCMAVEDEIKEMESILSGRKIFVEKAIRKEKIIATSNDTITYEP